MTRTQIQQIVVILLLLVFGFVWMTTRKGPVTAPSVMGAATEGPPPETAPRGSPFLAPPAEGGEPAGEISLARDLFQLPARLLQKIRDREKMLETPAEPLPEQTPVVEEVPITPPVDISTLDLQGIFWGTGRPQAIINRKILSVGDTIEGAEISAISKEGVTLTCDGKTVELKPKYEQNKGL